MSKSKFDAVLGRVREEDTITDQIIGGGSTSQSVGNVTAQTYTEGSSTTGYSWQDYEKTGTYVYVGYESTGGAWYIYRRTIATNARLYATGASGYATAWTNRASQTYS